MQLNILNNMKDKLIFLKYKLYNKLKIIIMYYNIMIFIIDNKKINLMMLKIIYVLKWILQ